MTDPKTSAQKMREATVPLQHPYGSITDGDWICGRCGETVTGCALCAGKAVHVIQRSKYFND